MARKVDLPFVSGSGITRLHIIMVFRILTCVAIVTELPLYSLGFSPTFAASPWLPVPRYTCSSQASSLTLADH